jgi:hypothetical protein
MKATFLFITQTRDIQDSLSIAEKCRGRAGERLAKTESGYVVLGTCGDIVLHKSGIVWDRVDSVCDIPF